MAHIFDSATVPVRRTQLWFHSRRNHYRSNLHIGRGQLWRVLGDAWFLGSLALARV